MKVKLNPTKKRHIKRLLKQMTPEDIRTLARKAGFDYNQSKFLLIAEMLNYWKTPSGLLFDIEVNLHIKVKN